MLSDKTVAKTVTCDILKGRLHAHGACSSVVCVHCFLSLSGKPQKKGEVKELVHQQEEMEGNSLHYWEVFSICGLST